MSKKIRGQFIRRIKRVRSKIRGTGDRPRLSVFRSNRYIQAQLLNDDKGITLLTVTDKGLKDIRGTKMERAAAVGKLLAKKAKAKKVKKVVFDRGRYRYHGRVKSLAEAARSEGLVF